MNIIKKIALTIFMVNIMIMFFYLNSFEVRAEDEKDLLKDMESQATTFMTNGKSKADSDGFSTSSITGEFKGLGQILTLVGAGVMVAVTSIMGIKYLTSPPDKQAALKQQLVGLVVAGIVIFGAYGIWRAVVNVVSKF